MRNLSIAFAVAAALSAGVASATTFDVYVSGASAQRNFFVKDLANICGVALNTVVEFDGNFSNSPLPDFKEWTCTFTGGGSNPAGLTSGDVMNLHYAAELGSEWGIAPGLGLAGFAGYPTTHTQLVSGSTGTCAANGTSSTTGGGPKFNCPATASTATYDYINDVVTGAGSGFFGKPKPDLVVADVEPPKWNLADNWAGPGGAGFAIGGVPTPLTVLGNAPTGPAGLSKLNTLQGKGASISGQIFSVVLSNDMAPVNNLSQASIQSIFQGAYADWSEVPEAAAAGLSGDITVCRRDHGSGSQTAASIFSTSSECGLPNSHPFVSIADQGLLNVTPIENNTGGLINSCITGHAKSIGSVGLAPSASYITVTVDGVEANAHNAAAGYYKFAYETWAWNTGANSSTKSNVFLTRAKAAANLQSVLGGETTTILANGQYHVSSGSPIGYYGLSANNSAVLPLGAMPVQLAPKNGESCTVAAGVN